MSGMSHCGTAASLGTVAAVLLLAGAPPAVARDEHAPRTAWPAATASVQERLHGLGCYGGRIAGTRDQQTTAAIMRFQSANGIIQSGRLSSRTRTALRSSAIHCDDRPVPGLSGTGRRIVVSQRQNYLWIVGADGVVVLQAPMVDNPSVLEQGTSFTGPKCGRSAHVVSHGDASGLWRLEHFTRFGNAPHCGIAFHRIPRSWSTGEFIHPKWMLGTNLAESHGCIRVSLGTARTISDFTREPTKVVVR